MSPREGPAAGSHAGQIDAFRELRAEIESSILPFATSIDGRHFSFQASVEGLSLRVGGYVMLEGDGDRAAFGQVRSLALAEVDAGEMGVTTEEEGQDIRTRLPIRLARGEGVILDRGAEPFHDHLARPATTRRPRLAGTHRVVRRAAGGGECRRGSRVRAWIWRPEGSDRHTFMCGQSGSGKSHSARPCPRATAARDGPSSSDPRPQLGLRPSPGGAAKGPTPVWWSAGRGSPAGSR